MGRRTPAKSGKKDYSFVREPIRAKARIWRRVEGRRRGEIRGEGGRGW